MKSVNEQPILVENIQKGSGYFEIPLIGRWIKAQTLTGTPKFTMCQRLQFRYNPNTFLDRLIFKIEESQLSSELDAGIFQVLIDDLYFCMGWIEYVTLYPNNSNNLRLNFEYELKGKQLELANEILACKHLTRHRGPMSKHEDYYANNPPNFFVTKVLELPSKDNPNGRYAIKLFPKETKIKGLNPDFEYSLVLSNGKELV